MLMRTMLRRLPYYATILSLTLLATCVVAQEQEDAAEDAPAASEPAVDSFAPPPEAADAEALLDHLAEMVAAQPESREPDVVEAHVKKLIPAMFSVTNRVLATDRADSDQATTALQYKMQALQIHGMFGGDVTGELTKTVDQAIKVFARIGVNEENAGVLVGLAMSLEDLPDQEFAVAGMKRMAGMIKEVEGSEALAYYAQMIEGTVRRMQLPGNEMKLTGETMEGEKFNLDQWRGKVVLVDFWASWCGPCRDELPNVLENYRKYHDKGFEVVGVNLDEDRKSAEKFMETMELPWPTLYHADEENPGQHPAASYYGINAIPTVIMLDREGKVVSLMARGEELERLLEELIGPIEEPEQPVIKLNLGGES